MLIFIENEPRTYAWGSSDALPEMLGVPPSGDPQAELWLGGHPDDPAEVAKATPLKRTVVDLIDTDPERYGVDGGALPFLLKVLAIGAPLSLQLHPDLQQAREGYAREEAAGVPHSDSARNYGDDNHKPELLVALTEVRALTGFRPLGEAARDLALAAATVRGAGDDAGAEALDQAASRLRGDAAEGELRRGFIEWAFSGDATVARALAALAAAAPGAGDAPDDPGRFLTLTEILAHHPGDPGVLVSLLMNHVSLAPGEAIYLPVRNLHAYVAGVGVEIQAASNNVLRAGLTQKHVDVPELLRVLDTSTLAAPTIQHETLGRGLVAWRPSVPDFELMRVRVGDPASEHLPLEGAAPGARVPAAAPLVLLVTKGQVSVARGSDGFEEVALVRRGQSLYVSAGDPIELTGDGEAFIAGVGQAFFASPACRIPSSAT